MKSLEHVKNKDRVLRRGLGTRPFHGLLSQNPAVRPYLKNSGFTKSL